MTLAEKIKTMAVARELVWNDYGYEWSWWAENYQIRCEGGIGYLVDFENVTIGEPHDTLDLAKAAAQADHNARIKAALRDDLPGLLADLTAEAMIIRHDWDGEPEDMAELSAILARISAAVRCKP